LLDQADLRIEPEIAKFIGYGIQIPDFITSLSGNVRATIDGQ
jgi:hypothetical protein